MKYKQWSMVVVMAVMAAIVLTTPVKADYFFKQVVNTDAVEMMGQTQPAQSDTSSIWMTEGKACMISADGNSFLYFAEDGRLVMIDQGAKTYSEMSLGLSDEMAEEDEEVDEAAEMTKAMMKQMMASMKVTVTPTDETKKVGDWNTSKYVMDMSMPMGNTTTELWTTEDIKVDYKTFKSIANGGMMMMPGYEKVLEEMEKVEGIAVYSVSSTVVMGSTVKSTMEVLEFLEKDAPAGIYDIPEGFKKVDMMQMSPGH